MIQTLFHEQPDDSIRVEEKVPATCLSVSDNRVEGFELSGLGESEDGWRESCWRCLQGRSHRRRHRRCMMETGVRASRDPLWQLDHVGFNIISRTGYPARSLF